MLDILFSSVLTTTATGAVSVGSFLLCTAGALILGLVVAAIHMVRNTYTKSFVVTLALLPAIVQIVIMLVNGNLGVGVAVMGAFSLVRFRSIPGSAREIGSLFLAMAIGLATGMGYLGVAALFLLVYGAVHLIFTFTSFGEMKNGRRDLRITIPESLDYTDIFEDLFEEYTKSAELVRTKTTNMGSLFQLTYLIEMKDMRQEKQMIDDIRCRNGNLDIICGKVSTDRVEL